MPANISEVKIEFGFGTKRGEYEPIKSAKATITAIVAENEDGAVILSVISKIARDKVGELLALQPAAVEPVTAGPLATSPAQAAADQVAAAPRTRRTKAQIEADNAAVAQSAPASEASATSEAENPTQPPAGTDDGGTDTTSVEDEWATVAPATTINDQELLSSVSAAAARLGGREKVLELKEQFRNVPADQTFGVTQIPAELRADFLAKLAKLS